MIVSFVPIPTAYGQLIFLPMHQLGRLAGTAAWVIENCSAKPTKLLDALHVLGQARDTPAFARGQAEGIAAARALAEKVESTRVACVLLREEYGSSMKTRDLEQVVEWPKPQQ